MLVTLFLGISTLCVLAGPTDEPPISIGSLLEEMISRDSAARFPEPGFSCKQFSSYDRRAAEPGGEDWFANLDNRQYLRTETIDGRTEEVLMDTDGPGAIVRFWVTSEGPGHGDGILRFYFDGSAEPEIEGEALELISGRALALRPLAESVPQAAEPSHRGHNLYLPIPYGRSCKVTFEPSDERPFFYQINYRTYPDGTAVRTFSMDELERVRSRVRSTEYVLSSGGRALGAECRPRDVSGVLPPGASITTQIAGPAAIRRIVVNLDAADRDQALRSTVLEIAFDGERTVWCPAGDFFGTGHQVHAFRTWYTETSVNGTMTCWWVMPFSRNALVTLHNLGEQEVAVVLGEAAVGPWDWDERSMHFHSTWWELYHHRTGGHTAAKDVNYVTVDGQGVYMGDTLTIFNGTEGWGWWGEGDEKVYVDGEAFPSHFGTGTEDYYGYAWARSQHFESAFHAQPCGVGNEYAGYSINSRYRGLDAIPFEQSIRFDMELWHHRDTYINYAPVTFWYARPGARGNVAPDHDGVKKPVAHTREDVIEVFRVNGAIEGETMKIVEKTGGENELQHGFPGQWSNEKQVWWRDGAVGDRIVFEFPAEREGRFTLFAGLTKANDYAIVRLFVNGRAVAQDFDRYHERVSDDELTLGEFDLRAGPNRLEVEIVGANKEAIKRHMFGLDYVRVE